MIHKGTYDGTIYHNPANRFCIISVKTADKEVPLEARSTRRYRDHLIRFVATGYELPRTDAVELELDGEWKQGKYGMQFQVEQWRQIVPRTKSGVEGYLASGLTRRDAVECNIGRNRYRTDLAGKDIVTHSQVGGSVETIYIGELMGDVGGEVIAAYLNHLGIF